MHGRLARFESRTDGLAGLERWRLRVGCALDGAAIEAGVAALVARGVANAVDGRVARVPEVSAAEVALGAARRLAAVAPFRAALALTIVTMSAAATAAAAAAPATTLSLLSLLWARLALAGPLPLALSLRRALSLLVRLPLLA